MKKITALLLLFFSNNLHAAFDIHNIVDGEKHLLRIGYKIVNGKEVEKNGAWYCTINGRYAKCPEWTKPFTNTPWNSGVSE